MFSFDPVGGLNLPSFHQAGLPFFAPEIFCTVDVADPIRTKQLRTGLQQLGEEGAIQVFRPYRGGPLLLGAVGQLQIEVVAHRLETEYSARARMTPSSYRLARWITSKDAAELQRFLEANAHRVAHDVVDAPAVLYNHESELRAAYEIWPRQLLPTCSDPLCHRVAFMFGHPYLEPRLAPGIHTPEELHEQFGSMPIAMYLHAGQNVRRGFAAMLDARRCTCSAGDESSRRGCPTHRYLQRAPFEKHHVTLITGTENGIWHPDSIHRMHEHLMSGAARRSTKHVLRGYAHQDLLWGADAYRDVFPLIEHGLERR